jgi:ElaB/YqjD/DUF883 family membrane-anchored ribosome-binding protein
MKDPAVENPGNARERLEEQANRVRSRLIDDLGELKARGRSVAERVEALEATVRRHPGVLVGVAAAAAIALGAVLYLRRGRRRRELRRDALFRLAGRLLGPSYVVEPVEPRHSMLGESLKKAGSAFVAAAGRELGRRALQAITTPVSAGGEDEGRAPA